ncbi:hypothetical protein DFH09DRAFT_989097 [Mycena vulgaris]|nr:hypothetical protein DFH09DRAFT_989097 [Mycena vulgaris]
MSSPPPENLHIFFPTFPFDAPDTDLILRSSDGVDFHLARAVLSLVSPVFRDMFSLPQPESAPAVPIITVTEDAGKLDRALRFFYPGAQPTITTLDELRDVIEILVSKYDIQWIVPTVKQHLERYIGRKPFSVYTIASIHDWRDLVLAAAKELLKFPLPVFTTDVPQEIRHITGVAYHNLLSYHLRCGAVAKATTADLSWIEFPTVLVWFTCNTCNYHCAPTLSDGIPHAARRWFMEYFTEMGAVLMETPGINLREHPRFYKALREAARCGVCAEGMAQLDQFVSGTWANKIELEIDQVELHF